MVRRSGTTSRGTTYWFMCFCLPVSRVCGLRMRKFSELYAYDNEEKKKIIEAIKDTTNRAPGSTRLSTWQRIEGY